jgi:selenocysteine lyase/cysteine desulfurase
MRAVAGPLASGWPDGRGYLLNHSAGLPPLTSAQAMQDALYGPWHGGDDRVWEHWLARLADFRAAVARVLSSQGRQVCPQPSVTAALAQLLGGLPASPGRRRLLIAGRAFPSLGFLLGQLERRGFEAVLLDDEADTRDPATWAELLDERVHCVVFTHVYSNTGLCHDMAPLCRLARERGAFSVVDVAQSVGIRRIDAEAWGADFVIGSCIKWLCGGSGAGFLWARRERLADCEPVDVGWFSHADPFEFDIRSFRYADDAMRFLGGTPNMPPAIIATHSIERLLDVGLERIEAHNQALLDRLIDALPPGTLVSPADAARRGGSAVVHLGDRQDDFVARLRSGGVRFDVRREGVRLSPHLYNTGDDIDRVLRCL